MRLIIQRVKRATLKVHDRVFSEIDEGLLVLVGITHEDQEEDLDWLANKLTNMRLFSDENDKMNLCVSDLVMRFYWLVNSHCLPQRKKEIGHRSSMQRDLKTREYSLNFLPKR
jgi:D-tyrosyl-tRNA(Tyr) deacylase